MCPGSFVVASIPWFGVYDHNGRGASEGRQPAPMPRLELAPGGAPMGVCAEYGAVNGCCLNRRVR